MSRDAALSPASVRTRRYVGVVLVVLVVAAVVLVAATAPAPVRAPVVLLAATFGPGYPLVARLPFDLPTLLALDAATSLALEAGTAFVLVQTRTWHPQLLGLGLAAVTTGATLAVLGRMQAEQEGPA